jgi:hypothetical protein
MISEFGTAFLCTVHLGIGFVAALRFSRLREERHASQLLPAINHFGAAYLEAAPVLERLPEQLQQQAAALSVAVESLGEKLHANRTAGHAHHVNAAKVAKGSSQHEARSPGSGDIPSAIDPPLLAAFGSEAARRYYPNEEFIALLENESEAIESFERVQCHDLSSTGISFYLDRPLDCQQLVAISLGSSGDVVFMAAKVIYSRFVLVRGEERYRIGCRFVRRLGEGEQSWKEQLRNSSGAD